MNRSALWATVFACLPSLLLAAPELQEISVSRAGDDLVITWVPPPAPVSGYRVYRSYDDPDCATPELVYEAAGTSYTDSSALLDPRTALYRIATFDDGGEGALTNPVYKYVLPIEHDPATANHNLPSLPPNGPYADAVELCTELNGGRGLVEPIETVMEYSPFLGRIDSQFCPTTFFSMFTVRPGRAYGMSPRGPMAAPVYVFGHGHPAFPSVEFEAVYVPGPDPTTDGIHSISLPWDHDYEDLTSLGDDIPNAVFVALVDPYQDPSPFYVGIQRPDAISAWTGDNLSLADRRGTGVVVGVDALPVSWQPRRRCGGVTRRSRITTALLAEAGPDGVAMRWQSDALATNGYQIFRVSDAASIPNVLDPAMPYLTVSETEPLFPIIDVAAEPGASGVLYYQIVGVDDQGFGDL